MENQDIKQCPLCDSELLECFVTTDDPFLISIQCDHCGLFSLHYSLIYNISDDYPQQVIFRKNRAIIGKLLGNRQEEPIASFLQAQDLPHRRYIPFKITVKEHPSPGAIPVIKLINLLPSQELEYLRIL